MNKKKVIGMLVLAVIVLLVIFIFTLIVNQYKYSSYKSKLCDKVYDKIQLIIQGDSLEANMQFIDNHGNNHINNVYINLSKTELIEKGYVEYIQSSDYMIEFYKKITINDIEYIEETEESITFKVNVRRPNLNDLINQCNYESIEFNEEFIDKLNSDELEHEEGSYNIIVHKVDNDIKFEYTDEFAEMLYS